MKKDKDTRELHRLYNKHELGARLWVIAGDQEFTHIGICSCGDIFVYSGTKAHWEPLSGSVLSAKLIGRYPEMYQAFKEYHESFDPKDTYTAAAWHRVIEKIDKGTLALVTRQAPVLSWEAFAEYLKEKKK